MHRLVEVPQLHTDVDDSTFGIIGGLFLASHHTEVNNNSSCSTNKTQKTKTKQCNIFEAILTHSRGPDPEGGGCSSWRTVQMLHTEPVVGIRSELEPDLSPGALMINLSCVTLPDPPL